MFFLALDDKKVDHYAIYSKALKSDFYLMGREVSLIKERVAQVHIIRYECNVILTIFQSWELNGNTYPSTGCPITSDTIWTEMKQL